jgi:phosphohistidine phosphatase
MGRLLVAENLVPELIISSTATRAKSTAQAVAAAAGYPAEIHYSRELYLADPDTYLEVAAAVDDRYQCLMLVGHNPGLEELVADLSGSEERMTTAALACVRLPISKWREISPSMSIDSLQIWRPKEIS